MNLNEERWLDELSRLARKQKRLGLFMVVWNALLLVALLVKIYFDATN